MDMRHTPDQDGSSTAASSTKPGSQLMRPKLYLLRHAESQAKEYIPETRSHNNDLSIVDPKLNERGRKQCIAVGNFLESQGVHVTHILSGPLSRALETACLTFEAVIGKGVKVWAVPELQSMGVLQNGTGMSLDELKHLYGDGSQCSEGFSDSKLSDNLHVTSGLASDQPTPGIKGIKGDGENSARDSRDFRGCVNFQFMCEDWNDRKHKDKELDGRYSTVEKRYLYLRGFLAGLRASMKEGEPLEVVLVAHSSILRRWVADPEWDTFEILIWRFDFDKEGELKMRRPTSRMISVPARETIEQQPHSMGEPAVMNSEPKSCPKAGEGEKKNGFLVGENIERPGLNLLRRTMSSIAGGRIRKAKSLGSPCNVQLGSLESAVQNMHLDVNSRQRSFG